MRIGTTTLLGEDRFIPKAIDGDLVKYDVVFGRGVIDLTELEPGDLQRKIEVNVICSAAVLKLDPSIPYELEATSIFGNARLPERNSTSFGSLHYRSRAGQPRLSIKLNVVFGSADVIEALPLADRATRPRQEVALLH